MTDKVKFVLRITPTMHKKLKVEARKNFISMNSVLQQIIREHQNGTNPSQK